MHGITICRPRARLDCIVLVVALAIVAMAPATAQQSSARRPYVFLPTPPDSGTRLATLEAAYVDGVFQPVGGGGVGQAFAVQTALTPSFGVFVRAGAAIAARTTRTSGEAELLWTAHPIAESRGYVTIGGGALRSYDATNALRVRFGGGLVSSQSRLDATFALEHPLARGRDQIDVISMIGWMRRFTARASVGLEAVGQDLEGFWETDEAEGGARLYLGPSVDVGLGAWQVAATAGPVIRASRSDRTDQVDRPLQITRQTYGVGLRVAVGRAW